MCSGQRRDREVGGTKDFWAYSQPASHSYRKNKGQMWTVSLLDGEGNTQEMPSTLLAFHLSPVPSKECLLQAPLSTLPWALGTGLGHKALGKCFLKTTAGMGTCTHIHRRLWKGSGTSCYHRVVSVGPCRRKGEQRDINSLATLQRNHLQATQQIKVSSQGGGILLWLPSTRPFSVTVQVSVRGSPLLNIVSPWFGCPGSYDMNQAEMTG